MNTYERHVLDYYAIHCGPLLYIVPAKLSNPALPKKKEFVPPPDDVSHSLSWKRESENDVVAFSLLLPLPLHSHTQVIILHSPGRRGSFAPAATTRLARPAEEEAPAERERLAMEEEEEDGRGKLPDYVLQTLLLLSPHLFDLRAAAAAAAAWRLGHV